jgi:hypothetical protein
LVPLLLSLLRLPGYTAADVGELAGCDSQCGLVVPVAADAAATSSFFRGPPGLLAAAASSSLLPDCLLLLLRPNVACSPWPLLLLGAGVVETDPVALLQPPGLEGTDLLPAPPAAAAVAWLLLLLLLLKLRTVVAPRADVGR